MLTRESAREYFKPLTYEDINETQFNKLVAIMEEKLGVWNRTVLEERADNVKSSKYYMQIYPHKKFGKYPGTRYNPRRKDNKLSAFIIVKCDNYSIREGISFNADGFIGFAGWSDKYNVKPFLDAFKEWVDMMKG